MSEKLDGYPIGTTGLAPVSMVRGVRYDWFSFCSAHAYYIGSCFVCRAGSWQTLPHEEADDG